MYAELVRKICAKCNVPKLANEFSTRRSRKSGLASRCRSCETDRQRQDKLTDPRRFKSYGIKRRGYGISVDEFEQMLQTQKNKCACCGGHESRFKKSLHIDHDHLTGKVRGLLCFRCNSAIGLFKEQKDLLDMAKSYLEKHKN